ncbi:growth hormone-regulated TBC protein 1 [Biomphalaria glabrata]|uniref:Growth hormone-regulated TBC protein 1 n=1 Tax=Biomphalaria glabrata TaxID=6526 RepID=A0A9W2YYK9_BIOGL|nr:growth hormone-regulated TBC protein 1-like isoform X2 [Biomphalaria glabrata]XP_055867815.1 growth hormone-regulated TBC protein 1-like isoform X2 [Biomphalaria glabrata]XP_055867816.1 growth hormone-regulated TBC protein 1-like isoform X2 [Biomphalaria glabrata]KAI8733574.1 growth hormone-regulated TBC protein 1-like [Biomphalaria glabrata]
MPDMSSNRPPGTANFGHGKVDPYGFERTAEFDFESYEKFMSTYLSTLSRRASRWKSSFKKMDNLSNSRKLKRFCRKGIPGDLRPDVWMQISKASKRMAEDPQKYTTLRSQRTDPAVSESILLDIHRTFPENVYFSELADPGSLKKPLQNVLEAISLSNPHLGYCQGMNFIAGLLLLVMKSEEKAFWLMDTLIQTILPDFYAPDMIAVKAEQDLLGELVKWKLPDLHSHLEGLGVQWCLVGMKWFICLYADVMPVDTVLRVWDCLFLEGSKILLRVALTLITLNKDRLLKCTNFPQAVEVFKDIVKDPITLECHTFMQNIFKVTGSMPGDKIKAMREKCVRQALQS